MRSKMMLGVLAVAGLFVAGLIVGDEVKASPRLKVIRMNCVTSAFANIPADGAYHTVTSIIVTNKFAGGIVHVSASGTSPHFGAPGAAGFQLTLSTSPDSAGPWFFAWSEADPHPLFGFVYFGWHLENCFRGMPAGPNRYYLNARAADPATTVEVCSMVAVYYANPITELCE